MSASTDNTAPVIRFSEVHKSFGEKQILSGFSMELEKGRTLAIMGPSGVGKSVTLKHAIGILTPDAGSVPGTRTEGCPHTSAAGCDHQ